MRAAIVAIAAVTAACHDAAPSKHRDEPVPPPRSPPGRLALWAQPGARVIEWPSTALPPAQLRQESVGVTPAQLIVLQKQTLPDELASELRAGPIVIRQGIAAFAVRMTRCAAGAVACNPDSYAMLTLTAMTLPEPWTLPFTLETATDPAGTAISDGALQLHREAFLALSTPREVLAGDRIYLVHTGVRPR